MPPAFAWVVGVPGLVALMAAPSSPRHYDIRRNDDIITRVFADDARGWQCPFVQGLNTVTFFPRPPVFCQLPLAEPNEKSEKKEQDPRSE